ncbi:conserved hypothetical protein [Cytophaga hutchinsonii ATCC 33406]|uniref:Secretion system C-terminal sorting domain-containing protein n=2 Tax=Cytophaga hutchinsonii TaxID=985 RepID=A0A6N4SPK5_CYTH3|nr:conserved hypothetical protein [Cytophaga hutchinsonii ATCC 33406]
MLSITQPHMKYIYLLLFLFCSPLFVFSQNYSDTDTSKTVKLSSDAISRYYSSGRNLRTSAANDIVPLKIHVVIPESSASYIDSISIMREIGKANLVFASIGIEFQLCGAIDFIPNNRWLNLDSYDEQWELLDAYNDPRTVDLFIVAQINQISACGYASLGWDGDGFIVIQNPCYNEDVLLHELGHYFNLYHTHDDLYGKELVNGSNCSTAGDFICDTPADPNLYNMVSSQTCQYTSSQTDANGTVYHPNPANFMSYAPQNCRNTFTPQQLQRMRFFYDNITKKYLSCSRLPDFMVDILQDKATLDKATPTNVTFVLSNYSGNIYTGPVTYSISVKSLYGDIVNLKTGTISKRFPILSRDTISVSVVVPANLTDGNYTLIVSADPGKILAEIFENNNEDEMEVGIYSHDLQLPDLKISYKAPADHFAGTGYTILSTVTNYGNVTTSSFYNIILISSDTIPDISDVSRIYPVSELAPGTAYSAQFTLPLPKNLNEPAYVIIIADYMGDVTEISEKNNTAIIKVNNLIPPDNYVKPDLTITNAKFTFQNNGTLSVLDRPRIQYNTTNIGPGLEVGSLTGIYISQDQNLSGDDILIYTTLLDYAQCTIPLQIPTGNYYILIKADCKDFIYETNELNNVASIPIHINNTPLPDLTYSKTSLSSYHWDYNTNFEFNAEVKNVGTGNCTWWFYTLYIQKEKYSYINPLFRYAVPEFYNSAMRSDLISAGGTYSISYTGKVYENTFEEGYYYIASCVTVGAGLDWEDNNCTVFDKPVLISKQIATSNLDINNKDEHISIFPNPANTEIFIATDQLFDEIVISTIEGETLKISAMKNQLDVSDLKPGIYLIKFTSDSKVLIKKIIISN